MARMAVPRWWGDLSHDGKVATVVAMSCALAGAVVAVSLAGADADDAGSSVPASTPATPPSVSDDPPSPVRAAVRNQGEVTLAVGGDFIDLTASPGDPTWGAGSADQFQDPVVFLYDRNNLSFGYGIDMLRLPAGVPATYEACSSGTGYAPPRGGSFDNQVDPSTLENSDACLRLDDGRFAALRLVSVGEGTITLAITTWESN